MFGVFENGDTKNAKTLNFGKDYNSTIELWSKNTSHRGDRFKNTDISVTPGDSVQCSTTKDYPESKLADHAKLQYYFEGSNYAYGITDSGKEVISLVKANGQKVDMLDGAGSVKLYNNDVSTARYILLSNTTIKDISYGIDSCGREYAEVTYNLTGTAANNSDITAKYVFNESSINVKFRIKAVSDVAFCTRFSHLERSYSNGFISSEARVNSKWIYPENLDYPYQDFESLVFIDNIDDTHRMYSFVREAPRKYWVVYELFGNRMPLFAENEELNEIDMTYSYDISLVDLNEDKQNPEYLGLFRSMNSGFAVGIAPTVDTDHSTVFVGDSAELNINLTNLWNKDLKFSLKYDIRDYYGNVVDVGVFADNVIEPLAEANRLVSVSGKYGMYYLNLYLITEKYWYSECYPFAILEPYTYKYNQTSPFGMATGAHGKKVQTRIDTARLYAKMGVANSRISCVNEQVQEMIRLGITSFNGAINPVNDKADNVESYVETVLSRTDAMSEVIDSIEVGNEMSLEASRASGRPLEKLYPLFYNYTYQPTLKAIKEKYPNLKYIPCPFSACEQNWINMFSEGFVDADGDGVADFDENGNLIRNPENESWSRVEVVATHIYGNPWMPDSYAQFEPRYGGQMWVIECGMQRMQEMYEKHRNMRKGKDDPLFYLTEVGYPTHPDCPTSVGLRTQADYTARIGLICSAYGVDRIQYYCMYDRTSYFTGFRNEHMEWNFGLCYEPDYYEVIKPKPAAIAFAAMTRQLESMDTQSARICKKYDEGWDKGGVRAFAYNTDLHGTVIAAYSNKQVLRDGKQTGMHKCLGRTPNLPWDNQWTENDWTVFDAAGDKVTVVDLMGNKTEYKAENGKVEIPLTGSPVYIFGVLAE